MEEERRLLYVGITRAEEHLFMTHAFRRTRYGTTEAQLRSRFLDDIPADLVEGVTGLAGSIGAQSQYNRMTTWGSTDTWGGPSTRQESSFSRLSQDLQKTPRAKSNALKNSDGKMIPFPGNKTQNSHYAAGDRVEHPLFGGGTIRSSDLQGGDELLAVEFDNAHYGTKRLLASLANLKKM